MANANELTIVVAFMNNTNMATAEGSRLRASCTHSKRVAAVRLAAKLLEVDYEEAEKRVTQGREFKFVGSGNSHFVFT